MTTTTAPTIAEQLLALETTAHRLATERDHALNERTDLLETNWYLQQEANRARRQLRGRELVEASLRAAINTRNWEVRRLAEQRNQLAARCAELEAQLDRAQRQTPEPAPQQRRRWRVRSRRPQ